MESSGDISVESGPDGPEPTGPEPSAPERTGLWVGLFVVVALAGLAAFGFVLWSVAPAGVPDFGEDVHVLAVPREIPEFSLVDQRGDTFDRSRLEGRWSLLFFGYTYCPDVCPMTLQALARVQALFDPSSATQVVFVSVDPKRDTVERLREYVAFFHPDLVGVTGEMREIDRLTDAMGVFHETVEGGREDAYRVDHTASLFLVDPRVRLHAVLHEPVNPAAFVDLLQRVEAVERPS